MAVNRYNSRYLMGLNVAHGNPSICLFSKAI